MASRNSVMQEVVGSEGVLVSPRRAQCQSSGSFAKDSSGHGVRWQGKLKRCATDYWLGISKRGRSVLNFLICPYKVNRFENSVLSNLFWLAPSWSLGQIC